MSSLVVREFRAYIVVLVVISNPKRRDRVPGVVFFLPGAGVFVKKNQKNDKNISGA